MKLYKFTMITAKESYEVGAKAETAEDAIDKVTHHFKKHHPEVIDIKRANDKTLPATMPWGKHA